MLQPTLRPLFRLSHPRPPGFSTAGRPIALAGSCTCTVGTTCCKFSYPCYLCSSSWPFESLFSEERRDSLCLMFKLQICFPETLQTASFDYILRTQSVTQWTINSCCCYHLKKAKLYAVKWDDQWYKYTVMPKAATEWLCLLLTELLWSCVNRRISLYRQKSSCKAHGTLEYFSVHPTTNNSQHF